MPDELLIQHCSPTLAGLKTGNLFACNYESEQEVKDSIRNLNLLLVPKGLRVLPLKFTGKRALIYIYRPSKLRLDLENECACQLLGNCGYNCKSPSRCILKLIQRLHDSAEFPHEIGLFLGYPPEDVQGFIENNAQGCKYIGLWKVYGDEELAKKRFSQYQRCTAIYNEQWAKGKTIEQLAAAVS